MTINPKYEESIKETIVMMYQSGITVQNIVAEIEGVTAHDVRGVLKEHGVIRNPGRRATVAENIDEATTEEMLKDYYEGMATRELVEKYRLGRIDRLYMILRELGQPARINLPERIETKSMQVDHAMELYVRGMPLWQIEEETGVNRITIQNERHKRKLPGRRKVYGDRV